MAFRDYIQPRIPSDWKGAERTYAIMLQNVLDDLHLLIREDWLTKELRQKINNGGSSDQSVKQDYSEDVQDTGIKWLDGAAIKRVTQEIEVTSGTAADSQSIENLGALIRVEGYVLTGAGACYPVGMDSGSVAVNVWKPANSDKFKVLSDISGTAYITVYYVEGEAPVTQDTLIFFNDGYTEYEGGGVIAWGANQLTRPNNSSQGYTTNGMATLDGVTTDGRMALYTATGANYYYNSHVCTAQLIHVPASASRLIVKAARNVNACQINIALLPNDAPNSMDVSEGGKITTFFTLTTVPTDYALDLDAEMLGSDDYRIVINLRAKGDLYRAAWITKVMFE